MHECSDIIKIKMENKLLYKEGEDGEEEMMPVMLKEREIDMVNNKTSKRLRIVSAYLPTCKH